MTSWTLYECNQQEKFSSESKTIDLRTSVDIKHLHVTVKKKLLCVFNSQGYFVN